MPLVLICTPSDLEPELAGTPLWRADIERLTASRLEEAQMLAVASRPDLVAVDRDLTRATRLVAALREDGSTLRELLAVPVRKQTRMAVRLQVEGYRAGGVPVEGLALDLSQTGMLLEVRASLHPGDDLDLRFHTPGRDVIAARARVVRQASPVRFGVQFAGLGSGERERIRRFVEAAIPA